MFSMFEQEVHRGDLRSFLAPATLNKSVCCCFGRMY